MRYVSLEKSWNVKNTEFLITLVDKKVDGTHFFILYNIFHKLYHLIEQKVRRYSMFL